MLENCRNSWKIVPGTKEANETHGIREQNGGLTGREGRGLEGKQGHRGGKWKAKYGDPNVQRPG